MASTGVDPALRPQAAEPTPSSSAPTSNPFDTNPFTSPDASRPASSYASSSAGGNRSDEARPPRFFQSRRLGSEKIEKPWTKQVSGRERATRIIPFLGVILGLGIAAFLVWDGYSSVVEHKYCSVLDDDFSHGLNSDVWTKEIEVGGFGNGQFEMTTDDAENVYVEGGHLFIKAQPQEAELVEKNHVIDLQEDGRCSSDKWENCYAITNTTNGNQTIVPPARSGRINTKKAASIKYGRVEVTAKLPRGDWLWPAIWMMPVEARYGEWPASGEIDILESRGNDHSYAEGGHDIVTSAMHWGPDFAHDAWWRTMKKRKALRKPYSDAFHTFGLEWSQKYLFTYVDSRLYQVLYTDFDKSFWDRGKFPQFNATGFPINNTWSDTGRKQTPFDQPFYLIINLAVGGTNGWFPDEEGKPWRDEAPNAPHDFWNKRDEWLPTWTQPHLEVSRVQMWQQCNGDEEL